jgi:hypothetical protein
MTEDDLKENQHEPLDASGRAPYQRPELIVHGTVAELTREDGVSSDDGFGPGPSAPP